jgi:hypothetical protein
VEQVTHHQLAHHKVIQEEQEMDLFQEMVEAEVVLALQEEMQAQVPVEMVEQD